ncbi:MAG: hypothetical protein U0271_44520 [Polyangiaceae bacterium]
MTTKIDARRVYVAWEPRPDGVSEIADQLLRAMSWLRTLPILDAEWTAPAPNTGTPMPCGALGEMKRCLVHGGYPKERASLMEPEYCRQTFHIGPGRSWRARIQIVAGLREAKLDIATPNRLDLLVRSELGAVDLRQILIGLLSVTRPAWGYAGFEQFPERPDPITPRPTVGFLTYLSSSYGPAPELATPALVTPIPGFGTLIQAFDEDPKPRCDPQKAHIRTLKTALEERGHLNSPAGSAA